MLQMIIALQARAMSVSQRLRSEDRGGAVVEYGIVLAFIIAVLAVVLVTVGDQITSWFAGIGNDLPITFD